MSLSKLQTITFCGVLAAVPLGYQWYTLSTTRDATKQLQQQIEAARTEAENREREQAKAERQIADLERRLSGATASTAPAAPPLDPKQRLYLWNDNSPYVRVPKSLLSTIHFGAFTTRVAPDGKTQRYQLPPISTDGTPQPVLEAALGLSPAEADQLRSTCRTTFAALQEAISKHSQLKEEPFLDGKVMDLQVSAFADEGAAIQDKLRMALTSSLGADRTAAFWQQADPVFHDALNAFGAQPREVKLISRPGQPLLVQDFTQSGMSSQYLQDRLDRPLPAALQPYADAWANGVQPATPAPSQP